MSLSTTPQVALSASSSPLNSPPPLWLPSTAPTRPINSYHMITPSKSRIIKKKGLLFTNHPNTLPSNAYYDSVEPTCYTDATKIPEWRELCLRNSQLYSAKGHGHLSLVLQINMLLVVDGSAN